MFLDAEVDGVRLTNDDVLDIGYLFFLAGLDTVTASLDCMLSYLAAHPEQRQRLVDEPEVIPHAMRTWRPVRRDGGRPASTLLARPGRRGCRRAEPCARASTAHLPGWPRQR